MTSILDGVDPALLWALRIGLAGLLLGGAFHKLRAPTRFRSTVETYALLPRFAVGPFAALLPTLELATAVALLVWRGSALPGLAVAILMAVYATAIALNLSRGRRHIDCGCVGFGRRSFTPLSWRLVLRNWLLALAGIVCAVPVGVRELGWFDAAVVVSSLACAAILYLSVEQVAANDAVALSRDASQEGLSTDRSRDAGWVVALGSKT